MDLLCENGVFVLKIGISIKGYRGIGINLRHYDILSVFDNVKVLDNYLIL